MCHCRLVNSLPNKSTIKIMSYLTKLVWMRSKIILMILINQTFLSKRPLNNAPMENNINLSTSNFKMKNNLSMIKINSKKLRNLIKKKIKRSKK